MRHATKLFLAFLLTLTLTTARAQVASGGAGGYSPTNLLSNATWEFWDDFNQPMRRLGIVPDAPSGHAWSLIANPTTATNGSTIRSGRWFNTNSGAIYMSVSNNFLTGPFASGTPRRWNKFGGQVRWEYGGTLNGVNRGLGFILSSNADFTAKSPYFLHVGINSDTFYIQRELSANFFINETYPLAGGLATYLVYGTNYTWSISIVSNTITAVVAGMTFQKTDPAIGLYAQFPVLTIENTGTPTDQIFGKWESIYAGYDDGLDKMLYGGGILPGTTNFAVAGLRLEEGTTSARSGTVTLSSGLATVSTTAVSANSRFRIGYVATTATPVQSVCVTNIVNGTSFQIRSLLNTDANRVDWEIVEKSP